ncbi:MAG: copper resistance CopC/CopD family protein [Marmoricola sp.]
MRAGRRTAVVLGVLALVAFCAPAASAHDELVATVPGDGFTVNEMPATMRMTFAEPTGADDVSVASAGRSLPVSSVAGDPREVAIGLAGVPATETVVLTWRAVDEHDGHVTSGRVSFHVLDHRGTVPATPTTTPSAEPAPFVSVPANGFTVTSMPSAATFTFPSATDARRLVVTHDGTRLAVSAVPGSPAKASISLHGVRATETVTLAWRLAGAKGSGASGTLSFHVLEHVAAAGGGGGGGGPRQPDHALSVVCHVVGYLAMAILLGGLFFVSVLWPSGARDRRTRALITSATLAGVLAAAGGVYVSVRQVAPLGFADAIALHFGRVSVALALMWLLASVLVVGLLQNPGAVVRPAWRVAAVVVGAGLVRATGMSAHATQGTHATTGLVVDFLHLVGVSAWVGGLAVLTVGLLPRRRLDELEAVVPRFSRVAATSVVLIVLSGVVLAWELLGSVGALFSTHYGHLLLVKLVLVGFVLLAAMASKRWVGRTLTSAARSGRSDAIGALAASVGAETALVVGVLGLASLLVTSNPGL